MDRTSATKTVDSGSIPGRVESVKYKNWCSLLPCLTCKLLCFDDKNKIVS